MFAAFLPSTPPGHSTGFASLVEAHGVQSMMFASGTVRADFFWILHFCNPVRKVLVEGFPFIRFLGLASGLLPLLPGEVDFQHSPTEGWLGLPSGRVLEPSSPFL